MGRTRIDAELSRFEFDRDMVPMVKQEHPGCHHSGLPGYAQCSQDLFALWCCGPSRRYLELGAFHPCTISNTLLLDHFNWVGTSVERNKMFADLWFRTRRCPLVVDEVERRSVLRWMKARPSYVSLDVDAANRIAIEAIIESGIRPACMTVETNEYLDGGEEAQQVNALLEGFGMIPAAVSVQVCGMAFESWWVRSDLISKAKALNGAGPDHYELAMMMLASGLSELLTGRI